MNPTRPFHQRRAAWLLLAFSALSFEAAALWFQFGKGLDPCVMCVYERLAVLGLLAAGLLGLVSPTAGWLRWSGYLLWGGSAVWGLLLAMEHVGYQFDTSGTLSCSFLPNFPSWLPLDQWLPVLFQPTGYCDDVQWQWLSLTMPQWMIVVFAVYLLILAAVAIVDLRHRD